MKKYKRIEITFPLLYFEMEEQKRIKELRKKSHNNWRSNEKKKS